MRDLGWEEKNKFKGMKMVFSIDRMNEITEMWGALLYQITQIKKLPKGREVNTV